MKKLYLILTGLFIVTYCFGQSLIYPDDYVTDADGNNYMAKTIGDQVWTIENLRTTKYNDGTSIIKNALAETWGSGTEGKFAYFYKPASK